MAGGTRVSFAPETVRMRWPAKFWVGSISPWRAISSAPVTRDEISALLSVTAQCTLGSPVQEQLATARKTSPFEQLNGPPATLDDGRMGYLELNSHEAT